MAMLELKDVTISYKGIPAVRDIHMKLDEGGICGIVGESGSGKTTVIRAILGLLPRGARVTRADILFVAESLPCKSHHE